MHFGCKFLNRRQKLQMKTLKYEKLKIVHPNQKWPK